MKWLAVVSLSLLLLALGVASTTSTAAASPALGKDGSYGGIDYRNSTLAPKLFEYMTLVQVWPPAWLGNSGSYPFDNTYFTIHGLWPNYLDGTWPEFCNAPAFDRSQLSPIESRLRKYWTNFRDEVQFWDHEYTKHLTCMLLSPHWKTQRACFEFGLNAQNGANLMGWLRRANVTPSNTRKYSVANLAKALDQHVGAQSVIECKSGSLYQIYTCYTEAGKKRDCPDSLLRRRCSDSEIFVNQYARSNSLLGAEEQSAVDSSSHRLRRRISAGSV